MSRTPNTHGGGARTNKNGLHFEQTTSLDNALCNAGYKVTNYEVYRGSQKIGMSVPQKKLYTYFLNPHGIQYADYNSKEWRPDEAFINFENNTVYIIEKKFQNLFNPLDFKVEFIYLFNDWFLDKRYRDTLDYIKSMGCHYFYNEIPLAFLGL